MPSEKLIDSVQFINGGFVMTKTEQVVDQWQDVRNGLIKEVELIPAEQMNFKPRPRAGVLSNYFNTLSKASGYLPARCAAIIQTSNADFRQ
jgi:hypothetical protein